MNDDNEQSNDDNEQSNDDNEQSGKLKPDGEKGDVSQSRLNKGFSRLREERRALKDENESLKSQIAEALADVEDEEDTQDQVPKHVKDAYDNIYRTVPSKDLRAFDSMPKLRVMPADLYVALNQSGNVQEAVRSLVRNDEAQDALANCKNSEEVTRIVQSLLNQQSGSTHNPSSGGVSGKADASLDTERSNQAMDRIGVKPVQIHEGTDEDA